MDGCVCRRIGQFCARVYQSGKERRTFGGGDNEVTTSSWQPTHYDSPDSLLLMASMALVSPRAGGSAATALMAAVPSSSVALHSPSACAAHAAATASTLTGGRSATPSRPGSTCLGFRLG